MKLSYDYNDLIHELHADVKEGLVIADGQIKVERGETIVVGRKSYASVIDYFYDTDDVDQMKDVNQERVQTIKVTELMIEMLKMNEKI
ncbi:hypothetical protein ERX35_007770 [Macrococcus equipercicus]|uniref:Phage protein n=1 Tax=Macrococcus equipercicus TaxID=69967 RepID=A0ABQ6R7N4_9STAP|nr:hypothetical protein [Macrococcus equipercicus]KAA1039104.1 hypothetical protein ERX35_007770 [Macrococcus equipercicus]